MKIAIKKEPGANPAAGFHYMAHPVKVTDEEEPIFFAIGYTVIQVSEDAGDRILRAAGAALSHQVEIAMLMEKALQQGQRS